MKSDPNNLDWFEMRTERHRDPSRTSWIPLLASETISSDIPYGHNGHTQEFFGAGSVAIRRDRLSEVSDLSWMSYGISASHSGFAREDGIYVPANELMDVDGRPLGVHLALQQPTLPDGARIWHLSEDFVTTMGLVREGDAWVAPNEGYEEFARLRHASDGAPSRLEVRTSRLRDYLCARDMALFVTTFHERIAVVADVSWATWEAPIREGDSQDDLWEGRVIEIHEGGMPFGESVLVFHGSRTDVDFGEDVPEPGFPSDDGVKSESWSQQPHGRKFYRASGEWWRNYWIEPAELSPIARRDSPPATIHFITDAEGTLETRETLVDEIRWLWFTSSIVAELLRRRGAWIRWESASTGAVSASPDSGVHFGVNDAGLINVLAKDIADLPDWVQAMWAAHNVGPDGGVSAELLTAQMQAVSPVTDAPESRFRLARHELNLAFRDSFGVDLFQNHADIEGIESTIHRFRSDSRDELCRLAKDIARITADAFDKGAIRNALGTEADGNLGSLKLLEDLAAEFSTKDEAYSTMGPIHGAYQLRLGDAHLPSSEIDDAFELLGVDEDAPGHAQGARLIEAVATALESLTQVLRPRTGN